MGITTTKSLVNVRLANIIPIRLVTLSKIAHSVLNAHNQWLALAKIWFSQIKVTIAMIMIQLKSSLVLIQMLALVVYKDTKPTLKAFANSLLKEHYVLHVLKDMWLQRIRLAALSVIPISCSISNLLVKLPLPWVLLYMRWIINCMEIILCMKLLKMELKKKLKKQSKSLMLQLCSNYLWVSCRWLPLSRLSIFNGLMSWKSFMG